MVSVAEARIGALRSDAVFLEQPSSPGSFTSLVTPLARRVRVGESSRSSAPIIAQPLDLFDHPVNLLYASIIRSVLLRAARRLVELIAIY